MRSLCMLCSFRMMPPTVPNLPGVRSFEDFVTLFSHSSGRLPSARVRTLPMQLITVARQQQLMGLCRHDGSKVCLWQHARRAPQASGANAAASATSTLASWSHRIWRLQARCDPLVHEIWTVAVRKDAGKACSQADPARLQDIWTVAVRKDAGKACSQADPARLQDVGALSADVACIYADH
eukprot:s5382_g2.t1